MKVALVYDRVNKWGGAEQQLLALHELFPNAPLYTSVYSPQKAQWAKVFPKVYPTFLQNIPILRSYHQLLGWLTPLAYETFSFDEYDVVISITSEAAKGIITKPSTKHICICLTPTRYLWSGYEEYLKNRPSTLRWIPFYRILSKPFLKYTKYWDLIAAQRPDIMVAISNEVRSRIKKYYKRDSYLIFPPVSTKMFSESLRTRREKEKENNFMEEQGLKKGNYFLIVSRLEPYKKVDLAVSAFNKLGYQLVVVGTGGEERKLKAIAEKNIKLVGFVGEKELLYYYRGAKAFIYPQEEDFGITSVEAQAAGVPVIAYRKGGVLDTVIDGETGIFFDKQNRESLISAVKKFNHMKFNTQKIQKNAERFSKEHFKKDVLALVENI